MRFAAFCRFIGFIGLLHYPLKGEVWRAGSAEYRQLRETAPDPARVMVVEDVRLEKPGAVFRFKSGRIVLLAPVLERRLGAVFEGEGELEFSAPTEDERRQTARFNKGQEAFKTAFTGMVMWFSDDTEARLAAQGKFAEGGPGGVAKALADTREFLREKARQNIEAEVLRSAERNDGGYFFSILTTRSLGRMLYSVTPNEWEDIMLARWSASDGWTTWNSFPRSGKREASKDQFDVEEVTVDARIGKDTHLTSTAKVTFRALKGAGHWTPLTLAPKLRVREVTDESGAKLEFVQEHEKKDADLWVVAAARLEEGKRYSWSVQYSGKDVIETAGRGNYFVRQRTQWFPRVRDASEQFADRARFRMTFRVPKENTLVATGKLLNRKIENEEEVTEWDTETPSTVAGFNYGKFKLDSANANGYEAAVYHNTEQNDELKELQLMIDSMQQKGVFAGMSTGGLNTSGMGAFAAAQSVNALQLFGALFGEPPQKRVSVTQQPSSVFGQSWPGLVFMPFTAFIDSTTRVQLGFTSKYKQFLDVVAPHEIAHQWWGHKVAWRDYRDQWISEGFAEYSAALYVQRFQGENKFLDFLKDRRARMTAPLPSGKRPVDAGPLTLGVRLEADDAPGAYSLVYTKGAFIPHMLRMLMKNMSTGDEKPFFGMMRAVAERFKEEPVTTEGLEALVSKHCGRDMHWFFEQWVYGAAWPRFEIEYSLKPEGNGAMLRMTGRITGTPDGFQMPVPVKIVFKKGSDTGRLRLSTKESTGEVLLPEMPRDLEFNPNVAVLGDFSVKKR